MKAFIVYLMIVALLACPFGCATKLAAAQDHGGSDHGGSDRGSCCEKCQAREVSEQPAIPVERSHGHRAPGLPAPTEDGQSCLCEGAVFDVTARSPAESIREFAFLAWMANGSAARSFSRCIPSGKRIDPRPHEIGGRMTRVAIRSLQL